MFERTALVRDDANLHEVLEEVCRAISELLGYRAVVVNVYRPAFDDMLTSAAVGSATASRSAARSETSSSVSRCASWWG